MGADEVLAATVRRWDLSAALPLPKDWIRCPVCGEGKPQVRFWRFHTRSGMATVPHRCDVSFKCVECAAVWIHGVAISEEYFEARPIKAHRLIHPRDVERLGVFS